jgi:hypothetical protein
MLQGRPHGCQTENHLIDAGYHWKKVGDLPWADLTRGLDIEMKVPLVNGYHSFRGTNDRILADFGDQLTDSLVFINPERLHIEVAEQGAQFGDTKRKVWTNFRYGGQRFGISMIGGLK